MCRLSSRCGKMGLRSAPFLVVGVLWVLIDDEEFNRRYEESVKVNEKEDNIMLTKDNRTFLIHQLRMEDIPVYRLMPLTDEELVKVAKSYGIEV